MSDSPELQERKRELRREVRSWLAGLSAEAVRLRSQQISARVRSRLEGPSPERVALFAAMPAEPDLSELWAVRPGLIFPKVAGQTLSFWWVQDPAGLVPGFRGIREPDERRCRRVEVETIQLFLVPGLAFRERDGLRLGQGGGYYDRLLGGTKAQRWGICFDEQVREEVPGGDLDARMDAVITCCRVVEW